MDTVWKHQKSLLRHATRCATPPPRRPLNDETVAALLNALSRDPRRGSDVFPERLEPARVRLRVDHGAVVEGISSHVNLTTSATRRPCRKTIRTSSPSRTPFRYVDRAASRPYRTSARVRYSCERTSAFRYRRGVQTLPFSPLGRVAVWPSVSSL